jgi:hypothetical protein
LRNTQVVKDFGERSTRTQSFVGSGTDPRRQAELVEPGGWALRQTDGEHRHQGTRIVDVHGGERDQLRAAQRDDRQRRLAGHTGALRDDAAQQLGTAALTDVLRGAHIPQVQPSLRETHHFDPLGDRGVDESAF